MLFLSIVYCFQLHTPLSVCSVYRARGTGGAGAAGAAGAAARAAGAAARAAGAAVFNLRSTD